MLPRVSLVLTLTLAACAAGIAQETGPRSVATDVIGQSAARPPARGVDLYRTHCSVCHGALGRGDGPASTFLFPPARDFGHGRFKLVSTTNGVPLERDLVATLRRGMPGSAMPAWTWLPEHELQKIAMHVRELAIAGLTEDMLVRARDADEELPEVEARVRAVNRMTPGARLASVEAVADDAASRNLGARLYGEYCATCHADDGTGQPGPRRDVDGGLNWARDLTTGHIKGGARFEDLATRIRAGMPGTAMPATNLPDAELAALVAHVQRLIPPGSGKRLLQQRQTVSARRVEGPVPRDHDDRRWDAAEEVEIVLAPLWWDDRSILALTVSALHDGEEVAIRARWADDTGDTRLFSGDVRSDGVALQFSTAHAPPLFGMGAPGHPTNIWHWRSRRLSEVAGALDLIRPAPHLRGDGWIGDVRVDLPLYHRLDGLTGVSSTVQHMTVTGVDLAGGAQRQSSAVWIEPRRLPESWDLIFVRALDPGGERDVAFEVGGKLQVAWAAWNGAAGDRGPQKSISIWHELVLHP